MKPTVLVPVFACLLACLLAAPVRAEEDPCPGTASPLAPIAEVTKKYENPTPTVDVIIELEDGILMVWRKNYPIGWALPGGFVDKGEPVEAAAVREIREETGLAVELVEQFYVYSDPRRDPRQHIQTTVFIARPVDPHAVPRAADDAGGWILIDPEAPPDGIVFDHARILSDYVTYLQTGRRPDPMERLRIWEKREPL